MVVVDCEIRLNPIDWVGKVYNLLGQKLQIDKYLSYQILLRTEGR